MRGLGGYTKIAFCGHGFQGKCPQKIFNSLTIIACYTDIYKKRIKLWRQYVNRTMSANYSITLC